MKYTEKQIKALIEGIYDGTYTPTSIPEDLYFAIADYLQKGMLEGFGATIADIADIPLLQELNTNVYMFSAAKSFTELQEMTSLLTDGDRVLSYREFAPLAREKYDVYNESYLLSEYNTAIAQGDAAAKWKEIEKQKDILPNLRYLTIGNACDICSPLDGLTAPVDDRIWNSVAPTNHFNCKCILIQEDENVSLTESPESVVEPVLDAMRTKGQDIFINNVGKTGEIFTKEHPYFDVAPEYKTLAKQNFNLPLPNYDTN